MNSILSASRLNSLLRCPRAHYWRYEVGLLKESATLALRIGSAWARAMEARWRGADYDQSLQSALPEGELEPYDAATVAALLIGYYEFYGQHETFGVVMPEAEFDYPLEGSRSFRCAGKLDGLGQLTDGRTAIIESKTTGDSIAPDSSYWLRLRFNLQVLQYILAARKSGWDIAHVVYDVTRKPCIAPKQVNVLDEQGRKIVLDRSGQRVMKKNGEPRESGSTEDGYTVQTRLETPEEFGDRLIADCRARPEFYFARREVAIIDDELEEFTAQRLTMSRLILRCRQIQGRMKRPEQAWPRSVSEQNCQFCEYSGFCLQNTAPDLAHPPEGYRVQFNPELSHA